MSFSLLRGDYLLRISLILLNIVIVISAETEIFLFTTFRHGARAIYDNLDPITKLDLYGEAWEYTQELTPVGMRMHYLLGHQNRLSHPDIYNNIKNSNDLLVLTTDSSRTEMSVNSFLEGFFPHNTGKKLTEKQMKSDFFKPPVKLEDEEKIISDLLNYSLPNNGNYFNIKNYNLGKPYISLQYRCPTLNEYIKTNVSKDRIKAVQKKFIDKYENDLMKIFKVDSKDKLEFIIHSGGDTYIADWTDDRVLKIVTDLGIDKDEFYNDYLEVIKTEMLYDRYDDQGKYYVAQIGASKVFEDINNYMLLALKNKPTYKMIIYSAHDDDLSLFENFLKLSLNIDLQYPHYASQLSIILVHNTDNKKYFVKIKFDDVILWNDTFDNFTQYVKKNLVSSIKVEELCGFPTPREKFKKSNSMTIVLITLLSVFSLILILSSIIIYKLCTHKFDVEGGLEEFN